MFLDGACFKSKVKDLSRSGWGAVKVGPSGKLLAWIFGPVSNFAPQTSVAAEFIAPATIANLLGGP
eukprot:6948818-Pyramimonas_sp.AAC.1